MNLSKYIYIYNTVIVCSSTVAFAMSEVAEMNDVLCSPLINVKSYEWNREIEKLSNASNVAGTSHLARVINAMEAVNQNQVSPQILYSSSSTIRMNICDFPTQLQYILRRIVNSLTLCAAMEGEKDAIYDLMDTYPSQEDLTYVFVDKEKRRLSVDDFKKVREYLEEADVSEVYDTEQLKKIVRNALSAALS